MFPFRRRAVKDKRSTGRGRGQGRLEDSRTSFLRGLPADALGPALAPTSSSSRHQVCPACTRGRPEARGVNAPGAAPADDHESWHIKTSACSPRVGEFSGLCSTPFPRLTLLIGHPSPLASWPFPFSGSPPYVPTTLLCSWGHVPNQHLVLASLSQGTPNEADSNIPEEWERRRSGGDTSPGRERPGGLAWRAHFLRQGPRASGGGTARLDQMHPVTQKDLGYFPMNSSSWFCLLLLWALSVPQGNWDHSRAALQHCSWWGLSA